MRHTDDCVFRSVYKLMLIECFVWQGDSGGPLLVDTGGDKYQIAGNVVPRVFTYQA